jgi:hypothetical protein
MMKDIVVSSKVVILKPWIGRAIELVKNHRAWQTVRSLLIDH